MLGRVVKIEDIPHEIVGVMPARFTWGALTAWLPMRPDLYGKVTGPSVQIAGWLRDGVSELEAAARLKVLFSSLAASRGGRYPASPGITLGHPGLPVVRDEVRRGLLLLLTAVMLLGIVGCVNAGALLLARTTGRLKELGVRLSLGASRWQIVRLQLIEAAILTCTGAVAGVILATAILPSLKIMLPPGVLPLGADVRLEWRVLTLISVAALLMGLIASVLPAWLVTRRDVEPHLRQTATGSSVTLGSVGLWRTLIGIEVAMAMTLLVLTAVFARGLFALQAEPLGYAPERVVALGVTISEHRYPQHSAGGEFLRRAVERIRAIPGAPTLPPAAAARPRDVLPLVAAWHRAMGNAFAAKASPPTEASRLDDLAMHTAWLAGLAHTLANRTERTQ